MRDKYIFKQFCKYVMVAFLASSANGNIMAVNTLKTEGVSNTANIKGRVVDSNKEVLPGAAIQIVNSSEGTVSDVNGYYSLSNLMPGKYTIRVSYVGYETVEKEIEVFETTVEQDIVLSEGVELDGVTVRGALSGQRKAISSQKNSFGVSNVVSSEQVGKFPDSNIGDAMKRIPGINVQYDQGEARFGQVRGTSPDLSSVTINGNRMPSAEGDVRNVQLDLIPADMIQIVEVNKVVTADMDGDAIGGSVNLVTKSAPHSRIFNATLGSGYNWISEKMQINAGLTYGERVANGKLGVILSGSYQYAPAGSDNTEMSYLVDDDNKVVIDDIQIRQYYVTRERQSYSLSLDYSLNADNKISFKGIYNRRNDWENRYRLTFKGLSEGDKKMSARVQTKGGSDDNNDARLERQQTMDFSLSGNHQIKRLEFIWDASIAKAREERPDERYFDLQLKKQSFDLRDVYGKQPYSATFVDPTDGGKWDIKEITNSDRDIEEKDIKVKLDFSLPLAKGLYGNTLRFGAKYAHKTKSRETECYDYTDWYKTTYGNEYAANYVLQRRDGFMPGKQYQSTNFVSKEYLGSFNFDKKNGVFSKEDASGNFDATENITSAFLRFDQKLGDRQKVMLGLRMESTSLSYSGLIWNVDEVSGEESLSPTGNHKNEYTNFLPSILWKMDINDDLKLRASFTETISRPKYSYLIPSVAVNTHSNSRTEIIIGNPDLDPALSYNFDASAEYYFSSIGLASAGVFFKRINNFIVNEVSYGDYESFKDCEITRPVNGFDGNLFGLEVGLQRDFGFISSALKCLGFYGNYTLTKTRVVNCSVGNKDEQIMPGSPKHMFNSSLCFEKKGWSARLSYNYTSSFQDDEEYQSDSRLRRYYDKTRYMDLNIGYTMGKNHKTTIYAEATNMLNQPLRYYIGNNSEQTTQVEYYGVKANIGVKFVL